MANTTGYYEIYQSYDQWRWRFKGNNHEIVSSGEAYTNKEDCLNAIRLLKGSYDAEIYEV